jgi:hypothetical protein
MICLVSLVFVSCSSSGTTTHDAGSPSTSVTFLGVETTSGSMPSRDDAPRVRCNDNNSQVLVGRFVVDYNSGNIDGVESLILPRGGGFRFLSTQKWGVEMDRARVGEILTAFHEAGERIEGVQMGTTEAAGPDGIGGTYIRYGVNGAIKFQIQCDLQRIAAIAWDLVDEPTLRR